MSGGLGCPVLLVCLLNVIFGSFLLLRTLSNGIVNTNNEKFQKNKMLDLFSNAEKLDLSELPELISPNLTERDCSVFSCLDVYKCGHKMLVYVQKPVAYLDKNGRSLSNWSQEFVELIETIDKSAFATSNPNRACVFIPAFDFLKPQTLNSTVISQALANFEHWNGGGNNIIWSFGKPRFPIGKSILISPKLNQDSYRLGFDLAMPQYNPHLKQHRPTIRSYKCSDEMQQRRKYWMLAVPEAYEQLYRSQQHIKISTFDVKRCTRPNDVCQKSVLEKSQFCLIDKNHRMLMESVHFGCVPIIIRDGRKSFILPFSEVLDWTKFSIQIYSHNLKNLPEILREIQTSQLNEMSEQLQWIYSRYFMTVSDIVQTSLEILNQRWFPNYIKLSWNQRPQPHKSLSNPLFLNHMPDENEGFTAVVLAYDRIESLFEVMAQLARAPSLRKILIIWNNQHQLPPPESDFPNISKDFVIKITSGNFLSNRFFPYDEIETECILSIDDDIVMMTPDELEFGYQVWREFSDRIVGFPSRTHLWMNETKTWRYESEWTSEISLVLTGAAFYNKYWNYLYSAAPNPESVAIKEWVDLNMNCEDIAMNFLVSNWTGKAPIKVGPRKKFRCVTPQCVNSDMLSMIESHMVERTECVNRLAHMYGYMPLKTVDFRADPVLYMDQVPYKMKIFNDMGTL